MDFRTLNIAETLKKLNVSVNGLNDQEVIKRRKKYGLNTFYFSNEFLKLFLFEIFNPIVLILFIALIFTFLNKNHFNAIYISIIILITIIFNITIKYKREYPINFKKLRFKKTTVIRNGKKIKINSKKITIGDIVVIEKNTYIKADIKVIVGNDIDIESPLNNVYDEGKILLAGDYVKNGSGMAVVFEIGKNTEIYKLSKKTSQKRKQKLPFEITLDKINKKVSLFTIIITFLLGLILYFQKANYNSTVDYLVSLIITSTPIFYIVILVLLLIYFKKVNTKNITINSLGVVSSISDITTIICNKEILMLNELSAKIIQLEDGSIYEIEGNGYNDTGEVIPINPSAKYKDSLYNLNLLGKLVYLNNKAKLYYEDNKWKSNGSSSDIALLSLNQKINHCVFENQVVNEINNPNYLITFYKENDLTKISIRGNVEDIIKFCNNDQEEILRRCDYLKSLGYETIGVAEGNMPKSKKKKYSEKDIKNLNFIGLIGFINPLKEESKEAIRICEKENINIVIITNDSINNAEIFGKKLNIINKRNQIVTKEDITHNFNLGERIFDDFIKEAKIISNVNNEDLIKVVDSFKRQGEIICTIDNNIENIKVLKNSNISIANNNSLLKTSSDLTINNNLETIITFIKNGKNISNTIFDIMRYLFYCNIMKSLIMFVSIVFRTNFILSFNQILWIDLMPCILALGPLLSDNIINSNNYTKNRFWAKKETIKWILGFIFNSFIVFLFILLLDKMNIERNYTNYSAMFLIISLQAILLFYYQDKGNSIFKLNFKENWKMYSFIITLLLIQLIIFIYLNKINTITILIVIALSLIPITIIEIIKKLKEQQK